MAEIQTLTPDTTSQIDENNRKVLDALDLSDPSWEQLKKIVAEMSKPEVFAKIQDVTKATIHNSALAIMRAGWPNTEREKAILQLQARLFPSIALNMKLEQTAKPSGNLNWIIKADRTVDTDALKNLSPDQIREKIGKLNKADIKLVMASLDTLESGLLKQTIMQVVTPFVETMVQNGYTIEDSSDIDFLQKNAGLWTKGLITAWSISNRDTLFDWKKKYLLKWDKILPLNNEKWELTKAGIDISKINTVDLKASAQELRKQLPATFDKVKFGEVINNFLKSDNKLLKWIGDILKFFWALLGIDFGEKWEASKEKVLEPKEKRALLESMLKKDGPYDVSSFFDAATWKISGRNDDPKFQLYLADIDRIVWPGVVTKWNDGKYVYNDELMGKIRVFQLNHRVQELTGKLDSDGIAALLKNLDSDGKIIQAPNAPAPAATTAPAATERATETREKHALADLFLPLKNKTTQELLSDKSLLKAIADQIGNKAKVIQFQISLWLRSDDPDKAKRPDGKIWAETVKAYFAKYEGGFVKKLKH